MTIRILRNVWILCRCGTVIYKTTKDLNLLIFKDEFSAVKKAASLSSYEGLERILEAIDKARVRLDANVNMELVMELLLLTMKEN